MFLFDRHRCSLCPSQFSSQRCHPVHAKLIRTRELENRYLNFYETGTLGYQDWDSKLQFMKFNAYNSRQLSSICQLCISQKPILYTALLICNRTLHHVSFRIRYGISSTKPLLQNLFQNRKNCKFVFLEFSRNYV